MSFSPTHAKPFSAYNEWMKGVKKPTDVPVEVCYITFPKNQERFKDSLIPVGTFWKSFASSRE
jgi:hypothetical protein